LDVETRIRENSFGFLMAASRTKRRRRVRRHEAARPASSRRIGTRDPASTDPPSRDEPRYNVEEEVAGTRADRDNTNSPPEDGDVEGNVR
jgi:hypothetical protein